MFRITATLSDGTKITGPMHGCGGLVGNSMTHLVLSHDQRQRVLDGVLRICSKRILQGKPLHIYEPAPGCVAIYPNHSAASDGEPIVVPVMGTRFEVE